MRRADAYTFLAKELELWRSSDAERLTAMVGKPIAATFAQLEGENVRIEIRVSWVDHSRRAVIVEAEACGPSHWHTERVLERIVIPISP